MNREYHVSRLVSVSLCCVLGTGCQSVAPSSPIDSKAYLASIQFDAPPADGIAIEPVGLRIEDGNQIDCVLDIALEGEPKRVCFVVGMIVSVWPTSPDAYVEIRKPNGVRLRLSETPEFEGCDSGHDILLFSSVVHARHIRTLVQCRLSLSLFETMSAGEYTVRLLNGDAWREYLGVPSYVDTASHKVSLIRASLLPSEPSPELKAAFDIMDSR